MPPNLKALTKAKMIKRLEKMHNSPVHKTNDNPWCEICRNRRKPVTKFICRRCARGLFEFYNRKALLEQAWEYLDKKEKEDKINSMIGPLEQKLWNIMDEFKTHSITREQALDKLENIGYSLTKENVVLDWECEIANDKFNCQ